ncbi:hypothetical protein ACHAPT_013574 [Fusarium lateritium]
MKAAIAHPLVATHNESLTAQIFLLWSLFESTGFEDATYLQAMIHAIDNVCPGAKYGRQTCTQGVNAFFDFEHQLSKEDSESLVQEVKGVNPCLGDLDPAIVRAAHVALCSPAEDGPQGASKLGDSLPRVALCFFLESCLDMIPSASFDTEVVLKEVKNILRFCKPFIGNYHPFALDTSLTIPTTSKLGTTANFHHFAKIVRAYVEGIKNHTSKVVEAVAAEHGALLPHPSIDHLMIKLGNSVDVPTSEFLMEQLGALQVALAAANIHDATSSTTHMKLLESIDTFLHLLEREIARGE